MEMFKVFLVDDENLIIEGLKIIINWEKYGFKIAGTFVDGDDAVEAALKMSPDVIITDIRMPGCNGLELIQKLKYELNDTKFIILSGYDDFKYAQTAIQYGAYDYILKPVGEEDIKKLLKKLYLQIKEENNKKKQNEQKEIQFKMSMDQLVRENILSCIKDKNFVPLRDINENYKGLNRECIFALIKIDKYLINLKEYRYITQTISAIRKEMYNLKDAKIIFEIEDGLFALVFEKGFDIEKYCTELMKNISVKNETISISYAAFNNFFYNAHKCYMLVLDILNRRIYEGKNKIFKYKDHITSQNSINITVILDNLNKALLSKRFEDIEHIINGLFEQIRIQKSYDIMGIRRIIMEIYVNTKDFLQEEFNISLSDIFKEDILKYNIVEKLEVLDDFNRWIMLFFEDIALYFIEEMQLYGSNIISQIKYYLHKYYYEEINLQSISKTFNINSVYLSQLFKKDTGDTFINYLTKIRVEKAKMLLENSDFNINEISSRIGYNNVKYFLKVFKKYEGVSPTQYKRAKK